MMIPKDWNVLLVVRVVDGDSLLLDVDRVLDDDGDREITERRRKMKTRLITLDTPERGEVGWTEARVDVMHWCAERYGLLRVETYGLDSLGRTLGDVYEKGNRSATLTQHMIIEKGWEPWLPSRASSTG